MHRQLRSLLRVDLQPHGDDTEALRGNLSSESSSSMDMLGSGRASPTTTHLAPHGFFAGSSNVNASHGTFIDIHNPTNIVIQNNVSDPLKVILDKLPHAEDAEYRCASHETCLPGTRMAELKRIEDWEVDNPPKPVYWLEGPPGSGKSTIAKTFAVRSAEGGRLGASFFCSRDLPERRNIRLIFPTLAYYLAFQSPEFRDALIPIIGENPHVGRETLDVQFNTFLVQPLKSSGIRTTIIIDALDECEDRQPESAILSLLGRYIDSIPGVKFFVTGRPELSIRKGFSLPSLRPHTEVFLLHEVDSGSVDQDIELYLRTCLLEIAKNRSHLDLPMPWPTDKEITVIIKKCSGLFIVASIIIKFVASRHHEPQERLTIIISTTDTVHEGRLGIDGTYHRVLVQSFTDVDEDETEFFSHLRFVIGSIVVVFSPLSCASLAAIIDVKMSSVWTALRSLHSIFIVPDSESQPIRICHKSLADYLTDNARCTDARFYIDPSVLHLELGMRCLRLMMGSLKRNICKLPRYAMNADIPDLEERIKKYIGDALKYGCKSWAAHLRRGSREGVDVGHIVECMKEFLGHYLLAWLEVLSVIGDLQIAVYAFQDMTAWIVDAHVTDANLLATIKDCERFVLQFFDAMESSASHIHESALPLSPSSSLVRALYGEQLPTDVKFSMMDETWDRCVRAIQARGFVNAVEFSHKDGLIAVGENPNGVEIFEVATGQHRATFETNMPVQLLAFSPDDTLLVADSYDMTNVWDLQTGSLVGALVGHTCTVTSAAFSPCGTMIASCSGDHTIRLWNVLSLDCRCVLEGHSGAVRTVCWSATGTELISGSYDTTIKMWSIFGMKCTKTFIMDTGFLVASPRGSSVVASLYGGILKVLNVETGDVLVVDGPGCHSVRFASQDQIMYVNGGTFVIRDLGTNADMLRFEYKAHRTVISPNADILRFAYKTPISPNGSRIVSSYGRVVEIWQTDITKQDQQDVTGQDSARDSCISFIVKIWRKYTTKQDQHQDMASHDGVSTISFSKDGQLVTSLSSDKTVKIWSIFTKQSLMTFSGGRSELSHDSTLCASWGFDDTIRMWNVCTGGLVWASSQDCGKPFEVLFSPDSTVCGSWGSDGVIRFWDVRTGGLISACQSQSHRTTHIWFSPDSTFCVSVGFGSTIRIWDVRTGGPISALDIRGHSRAIDICFPNGTQLVCLAYTPQGWKMELWDIITGDRLASIEVNSEHDLARHKFTFYPDGTSIFLKFYEKTYRWRISPAPSTRPSSSSTQTDTNSGETPPIVGDTHNLLSLPMDFVPAYDTDQSTPPNLSPHQFHLESSRWVLDNHYRRVLWLPPLSVRNSSGNKVVFGSPSGRIIFADFPSDLRLHCN